MMGERTIDLKIESAEDLKQVKWNGKMSPYAEASVYRNQKVSTGACHQGGSNPRWNDKLSLVVSDSHLHDPKIFLNIDILNHGALGKKVVGTVRVPLPELAKNLKEPQRMSYQVRRPSGRAQGVLNFVVTVGEKREVSRAAMPQQQAYMQAKPGQHQEPVTAYPMGYPPVGQPYPQGMYQQQPQYQQQYSPYPPQPQYAPYAGGMYAQQQRPPRRHGGMGMGLGAGLLGGLLLGEVLDNDCGDYGGGGYDGGGFDGGGFDGGF
eukprot:TRINITY_DN8297_c0_g1_i1.p1 TRINITY_DN8297_c0_g1~~TRINITY_DN8297_c0_g1_i1.p1  ORF type:complete len:263 (+),score=37.11 TRINITY_DN8297_c0_g1_i1:294-1082(+)